MFKKTTLLALSMLIGLGGNQQSMQASRQSSMVKKTLWTLVGTGALVGGYQLYQWLHSSPHDYWDELFETIKQNGNNKTTGLEQIKAAVQEACKKGFDINTKKYERTLLHHLCHASIKIQPEALLAILTFLVEQGADVTVADENGYTALHAACGNGEPALEIIQFLIDHKADITAINSQKKTVLHTACNNPKNTPKIIQLLLDKNAKALQQGDNEGNTPLHRATNKKVIELLCAQSPVLARKQNSAGQTPLFLALRTGELGAVQALAPLSSINTTDRNGRNLLDAVYQWATDLRLDYTSTLPYVHEILRQGFYIAEADSVNAPTTEISNYLDIVRYWQNNVPAQQKPLNQEYVQALENNNEALATVIKRYSKRRDADEALSILAKNINPENWKRALEKVV